MSLPGHPASRGDFPSPASVAATNAPWREDACGLLDRYARGETTPSAVLDGLLARIAHIDPVIGAFSVLDPAAHEAARTSDARWAAGKPRGALDGVPLVVKDNLVLRGLPVSWGNAALAERPCTTDELPVERLRAAGAVFVGKGNTPEFAVEGYTANSRFGVTGNPFAPTLTPGGSSGGVAAAVAAGLASAGIGTDGGGSIRRPAGYCGLVGLKPGIGRVARAHGLPRLLLDFEVVGPLCRSVRDAALLFGVLAGADRGDPTSRSRIGTAASATSTRRVLVVSRIDDAPVDPAILRALGRMSDALGRIGCEVRAGGLPFDIAPLEADWPRFAEIGLADCFGRDEAVARAAAPRYREMAARGRALPATRLWDLLERVRALRAAVGRAFADVDAILMPSSAAMPWSAAESWPPRIDGVAAGPRGHAVFTGWVNAAGHPALALPAPVGRGELPIGVQLVADLGGEEALLALGERVELEVGGFRWPAIARGP